MKPVVDHKIRTSLGVLLLLLGGLWSCTAPDPAISLGQGLLTGEVTAHSVILQARLTSAHPSSSSVREGTPGIGMFQLATDSAFEVPMSSKWLEAKADHDFIVKTHMSGLKAGTRYFYRMLYSTGKSHPHLISPISSFKTLPGKDSDSTVSFVAVTGMNYYFFHYGKYGRTTAYAGEDKALGYPALLAIKAKQPDYFIATGDNVYFDHPNQASFDKAVKEGLNPHPGNHNGKEVTDEAGMRSKYHEQFSQKRFRDLFSQVGTYWMKDDHDYRFNDADPFQDFPITHELGIKNFKEQLPVVYPNYPSAKTYRTHRMSKDLQIWLLEGRDHRSPNAEEDGPQKTLLGQAQLDWLKLTLRASSASFKIIISPTPMVGPDDAYKTDNHVNHQGFRHEGEALFAWLADNGFLKQNLYIVCGDRHWQYHAQHPSGFEEFSTGALVDNNARPGRLAGDPKSTDPDALIKQFYIQGDKASASGGFLMVTVKRDTNIPVAIFQFYDEKGTLRYESYKWDRRLPDN